MLTKTLVLDGDEGILCMLGDLIQSNVDPVGVFGDQLGQLVPFAVVYGGGKACRGNVYV